MALASRRECLGTPDLTSWISGLGHAYRLVLSRFQLPDGAYGTRLQPSLAGDQPDDHGDVVSLTLSWRISPHVMAILHLGHLRDATGQLVVQ